MGVRKDSGVWPPVGTSIEALIVALGTKVQAGRDEQRATHADVQLVKTQNSSIVGRVIQLEGRQSLVEGRVGDLEDRVGALEKKPALAPPPLPGEPRELDVANRIAKIRGRHPWPVGALATTYALGAAVVLLVLALLLRS